MGAEDSKGDRSEKDSGMNDSQISKIVLERLQEEEVDIPLCNKCNQPILFFKKDNGKWFVCDLDFNRHRCDR